MLAPLTPAARSASPSAEIVLHAPGDLAAALRVRFLELRHARPVAHPALTARLSSKVHLRLALPERPGRLWDRLSAKVRNQVRKGQKGGLTVTWGRGELLDAFYAVFS